MNLTYRELESFLAEIHRVAPEKRTALMGRLKHFQRLKWPAGTNKGKGARVDYGVGQTFSLAVGFEMLQIGLTPEKVVLQLEHSGGLLASGFREALDEYGPYADQVYYIFSPESLWPLRGMDENERPQGLVGMISSQSRVAESIESSSLFKLRRLALVNLSSVIDSYVEYFIGRGLGAPENLKGPIDNWVKVEDEMSRKRFPIQFRPENDRGDT